MVADLDQLEIASFLTGQFDRNNAIFSIQAGAGGTESNDWADMLFRMYNRWAERRGFEIEVQDVQVGESGRQMAARLFGRLTDDDIADLFAGARFDQKRGLFSDVRPVDGWVEAFKTRVRLISEGPPCPPV